MTHDSIAHSDTFPESSSPATDEKGRKGAFTILVPLDGSEIAARALPFAEDFCQRLDGEIALIRILPITVLPYAIPVDFIPPDIYQQMVDSQQRLAREYLEQVATELQQRGLRAQVQIEYGDASAGIIDAIAALHVTMVIMTTHGRTGLARFALGSVADRVVRGGGAPILLVRSFPTGERRTELRRALVPLDGSPLAESALFTIALQLAGPVLREITLVRVVDPRDGPEGVKAAEEYLDLIRRRFVERLSDREVSLTTLSQVGSPAASILASAQTLASDLILMSTHGEVGIGRLAFGSVTDRILRDGDTPILLVPPETAPKRQD